jgi:6-pyruvoyltetrahydropterin/6-carboxytetrahydropterin synthase
MEIWKDFTFEAAHRLSNLPDDHKCSRLHGHSYRLRVTVQGKLEPALGWVLDYAMLKSAVQPTINRLDHYYLNDIPGLENPTAEEIAVWIWVRLVPCLPPCISLTEVRLRETCTAGVVYRGEKV